MTKGRFKNRYSRYVHCKKTNKQKKLSQVEIINPLKCNNLNILVQCYCSFKCCKKFHLVLELLNVSTAPESSELLKHAPAVGFFWYKVILIHIATVIHRYGCNYHQYIQHTRFTELSICLGWEITIPVLIKLFLITKKKAVFK